MKIENKRYVLSMDSPDGTVYWTKDGYFTNDIREALMIGHITSAQFLRGNLREKYKLDLDIVTLKITYEWLSKEVLT